MRDAAGRRERARADPGVSVRQGLPPDRVVRLLWDDGFWNNGTPRGDSQSPARPPQNRTHPRM